MLLIFAAILFGILTVYAIGMMGYLGSKRRGILTIFGGLAGLWVTPLCVWVRAPGIDEPAFANASCAA